MKWISSRKISFHVAKSTVDNVAVKLGSNTTISKRARNIILQKLYKLNNNLALYNNSPFHYRAMHSEQRCQQLLIPLVEDMVNLPPFSLTTTFIHCNPSIFTTNKRAILFEISFPLHTVFFQTYNEKCQNKMTGLPKVLGINLLRRPFKWLEEISLIMSTIFFLMTPSSACCA